MQKYVVLRGRRNPQLGEVGGEECLGGWEGSKGPKDV
jgi:hypothetical protein